MEVLAQPLKEDAIVASQLRSQRKMIMQQQIANEFPFRIIYQNSGNFYEESVKSVTSVVSKTTFVCNRIRQLKVVPSPVARLREIIRSKVVLEEYPRLPSSMSYTMNGMLPSIPFNLAFLNMNIAYCYFHGSPPHGNRT